MKCVKCGYEIPKDAALCPACGEAVQNEGTTPGETEVLPEPVAVEPTSAPASTKTEMMDALEGESVSEKATEETAGSADDTSQQRKPGGKKKLWIAVGCVATVVIALVAFLLIQQQREQEYFSNMELGYHYLAEGNYEEAVISFEAAMEIKPRSPEPYVGIGDAHTGMERYEDARDDYSTAIELDPSIAEAYLGLCNAYIELGMTDEAIRMLEEGLQATNDSRLQAWLDALRGLSGTSSLSGTVSEYLVGGGTALLPGARVRMYVTTTNEPRLARAVVTDNTGSFSVAGLAGGEYILHVDAPDHIGLETVEILGDGEEGYTELFLLIPMTDEINAGEKGVFYATVTNAIDGNLVPDVALYIRTGWNNHDGELATGESVFSDADGLVRIENLDYGYYTIEAKANDFSTAYHNVAVIPEEFYAEWNLPISPTLGEGETRIILTWGANPSDLDSHLYNDDFHIYYRNKNYYDQDGVHHVNLDLDDTDSYGPETITIYSSLNSDSAYYVQDYTNGGNRESTALSESGGTVRVYQESGLVGTFHVPTGRQGDRWNVFTINANNEIIPNNTLTASDGDDWW